MPGRECLLTTILIVAPTLTVYGQTTLPSGAFTDVTSRSGIEKILADHYAAHPKWWISGLYLIDLDADGNLDFVTGAHGGGAPIAALNDGAGHFVPASGYQGSEVHICGDLNEDGKIDISMNYRDGGGKWWMNQSDPGHPHPTVRPSYTATINDRYSSSHLGTRTLARDRVE